MPKVTKDEEFVLIAVPKKDLDSLTRFIAHSIDAKTERVLELSKTIVHGDLQKQDGVVEELSALLDIVDWSIVLDAPEALQFCDELADVIYDEVGEQFGPVLKQKQPKLRLIKICVVCHKGYVKGEAHDCEENK